MIDEKTAPPGTKVIFTGKRVRNVTAKPGATGMVDSWKPPYVGIKWVRDSLSGTQADGGYYPGDFDVLGSAVPANPPTHHTNPLRAADASWLKPGMVVQRVDPEGGNDRLIKMGVPYKVERFDAPMEAIDVQTPDGVFGLYSYRFAWVRGGTIAKKIAKVFPVCPTCKKEVTPTLDAWYGDKAHPNSGKCRGCWI